MPVEKQFVIMNTELIKVLVSGERAKGAFTVFTETCPTGGGPPPHIHTREDEFLMPVEGDFEVFTNETWTPLGKEGVYTERGNLHTWRNAGETSGTILFVTSPGGFDRFLEDLVPVQLPGQMNTMISISADYGITYPTLAAASGGESK